MRNKTTARAAGLLLALWQVFWLSSCGTPPPAESGAAGPGSATSPITAAPAVSTDAPTFPAPSASAAEEKPTTTASNPLTTEIQHPASTTTGSTKIYATRIPAGMNFSTLEAYEQKLRTFSTREALIQALQEAAESPEVVPKDEEFEMLLHDRYFLLPVLPDGCTVTSASFYIGGDWSGGGMSEFTVKLASGEDVFFFYCHKKREFGVVEYTDRTTLTNTRGLSVIHEHIVYDNMPGAEGGYFTWKEDGYPFRMPYEGPALASYEAFIKALSFKKIPL